MPVRDASSKEKKQDCQTRQDGHCSRANQGFGSGVADVMIARQTVANPKIITINLDAMATMVAVAGTLLRLITLKNWPGWPGRLASLGWASEVKATPPAIKGSIQGTAKRRRGSEDPGSDVDLLSEFLSWLPLSSRSLGVSLHTVLGEYEIVRQVLRRRWDRTVAVSGRRRCRVVRYYDLQPFFLVQVVFCFYPPRVCPPAAPKPSRAPVDRSDPLV